MWLLILKTIHILLAVIAVGTNISYLFLQARAEAHPQHLVFILETIRKMDRRIANPCYSGVLVSGILMVIISGYSFQWLWVWYSLASFGLIAILGVFVFKPAMNMLVRHAGKGPGDPEYQSAKARVQLLGNLVYGIVLSILGMMIWKPI